LRIVCLLGKISAMDVSIRWPLVKEPLQVLDISCSPKIWMRLPPSVFDHLKHKNCSYSLVFWVWTVKWRSWERLTTRDLHCTLPPNHYYYVF
jgi:hypothetical protein